MAAETVEFELVSPEQLLLSEPVAMVIVPGEEGDFGVLPRHAPLISNVRPGVISVYSQRNEVIQKIFVAGGFAEVTGDRCTVLAETALPLAEIDRQDTEQRLRNAREDLADAKDDVTRATAERQIGTFEAMLRALQS
jgi:F-type H+-transporting ATPase subunit epsilon